MLLNENKIVNRRIYIKKSKEKPEENWICAGFLLIKSLSKLLFTVDYTIRKQFDYKIDCVSGSCNLKMNYVIFVVNLVHNYLW